MRLKRQANARKSIEFFARAFNFEKPHKFLIDPDFVFAVLKAGIQLRPSFENLFSTREISIFLTTCIKKELQVLAAAPGPRQGEWKVVLSIVEANANRIQYLACKHDKSVKCGAHECIKYQLDPYHNKERPDASKVEAKPDGRSKKIKEKKPNPEHFIMCAQHSELRKHVREIPAVPIVMLQGNVLIFESPSEVTKAYASRIKVTHHNKVSMRENVEILEKLAKNAPIQNIALESVLENKPIPGTFFVDPVSTSKVGKFGEQAQPRSKQTDSAAKTPRIAPNGHIIGSKQKAKKPNPLASKKPQAKPQPSISYKNLKKLQDQGANQQATQPTKKAKNSKTTTTDAQQLVQLPPPPQTTQAPQTKAEGPIATSKKRQQASQ